MLPTSGAGDEMEEEQMKRRRESRCKSGLKPKVNIKQEANPFRLVKATPASQGKVNNTDTNKPLEGND